jgi:hypothetical protein
MWTEATGCLLMSSVNRFAKDTVVIILWPTAGSSVATGGKPRNSSPSRLSLGRMNLAEAQAATRPLRRLRAAGWIRCCCCCGCPNTKRTVPSSASSFPLQQQHTATTHRLVRIPRRFRKSRILRSVSVSLLSLSGSLASSSSSTKLHSEWQTRQTLFTCRRRKSFRIALQYNVQTTNSTVSRKIPYTVQYSNVVFFEQYAQLYTKLFSTEYGVRCMVYGVRYVVEVQTV